MKHRWLMLLALTATTLCQADWRGLPEVEPGWADTGNSYGLVNYSLDPWIYSSIQQRWLYLTAQASPDKSHWAYLPKKVDDSMREIFAAEDMPTFDKDPSDNHKLQKPWNYDKAWNRERKYPLIVGLHGGTNDPNTYYAPCIVGRVEEMKQYPCFVLAPNSLSGWGGSSAMRVIGLIEQLIKDYRIDENRIYLVGFSMGGSGSYSFANTYYDHNGRLFAAIARIAGQSQTIVRDEIAARSAIWYHIGLSDTTNNRVGIARQAYAFMKNHPANAGAIETISEDDVYNYPRTTWTLSKNGVEFMKLSEYENLGHQGYTAFREPKLIDWIFRQSLQQRSE